MPTPFLKQPLDPQPFGWEACSAPRGDSVAKEDSEKGRTFKWAEPRTTENRMLKVSPGTVSGGLIKECASPSGKWAARNVCLGWEDFGITMGQCLLYAPYSPFPNGSVYYFLVPNSLLGLHVRADDLFFNFLGISMQRKHSQTCHRDAPALRTDPGLWAPSSMEGSLGMSPVGRGKFPLIWEEEGTACLVARKQTKVGYITIH